MQAGKRRLKIEKLIEKKYGSKGNKHPACLDILGKICSDIYFEYYNDSKEDTHEAKKNEALAGMFKSCTVTDTDEWAEFYKKNGYVTINSPLLGELIVIARNKSIKEKNKTKLKDIVVYLEEELTVLKDLDREQLIQLHEGKRIFEGELQP